LLGLGVGLEIMWKQRSGQSASGSVPARGAAVR
jgi:hypothetical protein